MTTFEEKHPEIDVLSLLAEHVRFLSLDQVARAHGCRTESARAWARRGERRGLLERFYVTAREPRSGAAVFHFSLGDETPDFSELSRQLRHRASHGTPQQIEAVRLGIEGAKVLGVRQARKPRVSEASHDLQLAEFVLEHLESLETWTSEQTLAATQAYSGILPDGEMQLRDGGGGFAVECGGIYSAAKLGTFHRAIVPQLEGRGLRGYWIV